MDADTLPYQVERYPLLITKLYIPRLDTKLLTRISWDCSTALLIARLYSLLLRPVGAKPRWLAPGPGD